MKPTQENGSRNAESIQPHHESGEPRPESGGMTKEQAESLVAKYERWETVFKKVGVFDGLTRKVVSGDFNEADLFRDVDEFVGALERHTEIPLKQYGLFINDQKSTFVTEKNTISLSLPDLMEHGADATVESILSEIRERKEKRGIGEEGKESAAGSVSAPNVPEREGAPAGPDAAEQNKENAPSAHVGDFVVWETNGTLRFKEPKRIQRIEEDPASKKQFAFFDDFLTGIPLNELVVREKPVEAQREHAAGREPASAESGAKPEQATSADSASQPESRQTPEQRPSHQDAAARPMPVERVPSRYYDKRYRLPASGEKVFVPGPDGRPEKGWEVVLVNEKAEFIIVSKKDPQGIARTLTKNISFGEYIEMNPDATGETARRAAEEKANAGVQENAAEQPTDSDRERTASQESKENDRSGETAADVSVADPFRSALHDTPPEEDPTWQDRVRNTAVRLADSFGIRNAYDWARIAYRDELADWQTDHAARWKERIDEHRKQIDVLEKGRKELQNRLEQFRGEANVGPAVLIRMEQDLADQERKIEEQKNAADRAQSKLENRNARRGRYENRRDEICRSFMQRIKEKLDSYEAQLSNLKQTRGKLDQEISDHRKFAEARRQKVKEIAGIAESAEFPSVRKGYRQIIKAIEREERALIREIETREKDRGKIDKKIEKQDKKANPLRDRSNKLARITARKGPDTSIPPRGPLEDAATTDRNPIRHPDDSGQRSGTAAAAERVSVPSPNPEFEKKYSPIEMIDAWNRANGTRMLINPETAQKNFPTFFSREKVSPDDLLGFAEFYAEHLGDDELFAGMPSMEQAARKAGRRGFWAGLFGRNHRSANRRRLLDFLKKK